MFYGTRFFYNLLYFLTAMSPAYLLFLLQINEKFDNPLEREVFGINFTVYMWCLGLFLIIILLSLLLKTILKIQYTKGLGTPVLTKDLCKFSKSNIQENNGSVISFLLGNIIPVVLIMESSVKEAVIIFILLQTFIFILTVKSSEIFPNVALIIIGVDICKTRDGNYLFIFNGENKDPQKVYLLGDAEKSKIYITTFKK